MGTINRLKIRLGIQLDDFSEDAILQEYLSEAESSIRLYLNVDVPLDNSFTSTQIALAELYYNKNKAKSSNGNVKSVSYSEGVVSQSNTFYTDDDYNTAETAILSKLSRYRRVHVKRHK